MSQFHNYLVNKVWRFGKIRQIHQTFLSPNFCPIRYNVKLRPDAKSYALITPLKKHSPSTIPKDSELLGVILRIDKLTQWCAEIVFVPKKDSSVHICRFQTTKLSDGGYSDSIEWYNDV